ncbi:hypothetical protein CTAYLR_005257 [Chrysophaeum taylorii]|uniref:FHA domain-containing protein n=1 Tax=Chrysophaeum taylorii TaxID=2483200 RepID=A0AAD7UJX3_9STRA|nr:hypothetical protein CTAYLR_005257 [Chrysophaeum taylorii]
MGEESSDDDKESAKLLLAQQGVCGTTLPAITVIGICGNIVTVVGVVIMNKYIQKKHGMNAMIFLSFCHFVVTAIGIRVLLMLGFFRYKAARTRAVMPVALGSLGSVAFMNLNLAYNSVGFYQISKLACIPVTLTFGYLIDGVVVPTRVKLTLVPLVIGMGIATVHDYEASFEGTAFASVAVLCTVASQTFTSSLQRSLACDSNQLLYHTSPLIAIGMLALCPIFDDIAALRAFQWTVPVVRDILLSCVLALGVNITNYLVLGKTSPLTYQVVGHLKTILTITFGIFILRHPTNSKNIFGIFIAMLGVISYSEGFVLFRQQQMIDEGGSRKRKGNFSDEAPASRVTADEDDAKIRAFLESIERGGSGDTKVVEEQPPPEAAHVATGPPKPPPPIYFDVVRGIENGSTDLLGRLDLSGASQLTFGRDPSRVDVALDHGSISRHHATMTFDRDAAYISDIKSTHGTFISKRGSAIETELAAKELTQLQHGDVVRFGESSRRYIFNVAPTVDPNAEAADEVKIGIRIPSNTVGRLIGRGGATIAAVQERTGAVVSVIPKDIGDDKDRGAFRMVEIRGHVKAVAAARLELLAITAGDPPPAVPALGPSGTHRFRYSSTVVNARGGDDDLLDVR